MPADILSTDDLEVLSKKILSYSKAEWAEVSLESSHNAHLRYAANTVTTSGSNVNTSISVTSVNGKRVGSASSNDLSDDGLHRVVRRAEEIASLAPENEEVMQPLAKRPEYSRSAGYDEPSTDREYAANERAKIAEVGLQEAKLRNLQTAGFINSSVEHNAYRNTKGLFVSSEKTRSIFSTTMRSEDGQSSGWNKRASHAIARLDAHTAVNRAAEKCVAWTNPRELDPGSYKTILEPSAAADLIQQFAWALDARSAEEGRSPFSRPNGATALGEQVVNEKVHLYSDPAHPLVPGGIYGGGGQALEAVDWVKDGKLANFSRSRYWAQKTGKKPNAGASNLIMDGGSMLPEDFLFNIKEGLLITSFWYIRDVDDQTLLKTGLTRDGLFWVEDGKIKNGVVNFRWNESPIAMLKNVIDFSRPVVTAPRDGWDGMPMFVPMLYVSGFNFSSLSDAV
ncbi:MAG: TldD/PmbA family protein [Candidatus Kapaibacterium sp.]|jgi:predicted Zn-dependent protease